FQGEDGIRDWSVTGVQTCALPISLIRLLQNSAFEPDRIEIMSAAFQQACRELGVADTENRLRELVARKIIECAQTGERNQARLRSEERRVGQGGRCGWAGRHV